MTPPPPTKRILITGASIAGPTTAYWLARARSPSGGTNPNHPLFTVTVLERAPALRTNGQGIDVRGAGMEVIRRMGLEEEIRAKSSHEQGLHFVEGAGRLRASFPVGGGNVFTSDVEISRGDLAGCVVKAAEGVGVAFVYGDYVDAVEEDEEGCVRVTYAKSRETHDFDALIIGDGLFSRTRDVVFGKESTADCVRSLNAYVSYFTIPRDESDDTWARWYNAPGRRGILLRPDTVPGCTRALLTVCETGSLDGALRAGVAAQKNAFRDLFADAGWLAPRVLEGMDKAEDFYMQKLAQMKLPAWTRGRVALVGDAGYCPSPLTGMGTTCAIVGAYVLAGEMARSVDDVEEGFKRYEERLRPFVERAQKLPPGAPWLANPASWWGCEVLRFVVGVVCWTREWRVFERLEVLFTPPANAIKLPEYEM